MRGTCVRTSQRAVQKNMFLLKHAHKQHHARTANQYIAWCVLPRQRLTHAKQQASGRTHTYYAHHYLQNNRRDGSTEPWTERTARSTERRREPIEWRRSAERASDGAIFAIVMYHGQGKQSPPPPPPATPALHSQARRECRASYVRRCSSKCYLALMAFRTVFLTPLTAYL